MKKIGSAVYLHMSMQDKLDTERDELLANAVMIMYQKGMFEEWQKTVIYKIDLKNKMVSFIECPDFDFAREPQVGTAYTVDVKKETVKIIKPKGQIYHHKWMFVDDDYAWFNVRESKTWSKKWQSILPKDRKVKSRIGYKKYWDEYLREYGLEVE